MKKSVRSSIVLGAIAIFFLLIGMAAFYPTGEKVNPPSGYSPIRDDELAQRYLPEFTCPEEYGAISAIYYRAARAESGIIHLAYHPVWERERNDTKGLAPFLSRWLYTGGLSLQRLMYGKGDVESIGLSISPATGEILEVEYETAADYSPADFGVTHKKILAKGPFSLPLKFRVISWNHLFALDETGPGVILQLQKSNPASLAYFSPELWAEFSMWKNPETRIRKDRAHFIWERAAAN